jgi:hypothetical protein
MDSEAKKQIRLKKIRGYLHDYGKLLVDISKLAFGSLVLGTVIRWDIPQATVFITGVIFSIVVATIGIFLARTFEET